MVLGDNKSGEANASPFLYDPKAINKFIGAIPYIQDGTVYGTSQVPLYADDNAILSVVFCNIAHGIIEMAIVSWQFKNPFQKVVVTTDAERVAPVSICRQFKEVFRGRV